MNTEENNEHINPQEEVTRPMNNGRQQVQSRPPRDNTRNNGNNRQRSKSMSRTLKDVNARDGNQQSNTLEKGKFKSMEKLDFPQSASPSLMTVSTQTQRFTILNYSKPPFGFGFRLRCEMIIASCLAGVNPPKSSLPTDNTSVYDAISTIMNARGEGSNELIISPNGSMWSVTINNSPVGADVVEAILAILNATIVDDLETVFDAISRQDDVDNCSVNMNNLSMLALFCSSHGFGQPIITVLAYTMGMPFKSVSILTSPKLVEYFSRNIKRVDLSEEMPKYSFYSRATQRFVRMRGRMYRLKASGYRYRSDNQTISMTDL